MPLEEIKILSQHGKQFISDVTQPTLPDVFRGRPEITLQKVDERALIEMCPTGSIMGSPVRIDMGKCVFCGECAFAFPDKIKFTSDYKIATNSRERLIVWEGDSNPVQWNENLIRKEIQSLFGRSLKLREIL